MIAGRKNHNPLYPPYIKGDLSEPGGYKTRPYRNFVGAEFISASYYFNPHRKVRGDQGKLRTVVYAQNPL